MNARIPQVSIGLPVYNGEAFLAEAIESVLEQDFSDFELIISDNASSDETADICRKYARQDSRIQYHRNDTNLGASANFRRVFELSRGKYFKWLAADCTMEQDALRKCVAILDREQDIILVCTKFKEIALNGSVIYSDHKLDYRAELPHERLRQFVPVTVVPIWGLMRRSVLQQTGLLQPFVGADFCLVIHLAIKGKFAQIPEHLMQLRRHHDSYTDRIKASPRNIEGRREAKWFDPNSTDRWILARWKCLNKIARIIAAEPLPRKEKVRLYRQLAHLMATSWRNRLIKEIVVASGMAPLAYWSRDILRSAAKALQKKRKTPSISNETSR